MLHATPKGKLLIIGGAEDKPDEAPDIMNETSSFQPYEILRELLPPKRSRKTIEVITTASTEPASVAARYRKAFKKLGLEKVGFINMGNNYDSKNPKFIERIRKAHSVLFSGGDQYRISTILGNTDVQDAIMKKYIEDKDFIVAGTSAGAMVAASLMMYEAEKHEALLKGSVKISSGLGFVNNCIIDTHFVKRGRFGRLAEAIVMNPTCTGIGLGEDTGLLISKGNEAICLGSGMVIILDGKNIGHTNISYAENNEPVCIENIRVHVMSRGSGYLINERVFVPSKRNLDREEELKG
jgi:cyanophycinase